MAISLPKEQIRIQFFDYLFGDGKGYFCIATASPSKLDFKQTFFEWPAQKTIAAGFIEEQHRNKNVWFCINLLDQPTRKKEYALDSSVVWADLDYIIPTECDPLPSCVIESSPGRYQAYWRINGASVPPEIAEEYSRKIAYHLSADKSGWDLTQLLRVPWTNNFKYDPPSEIKLLSITDTSYDIEIFDNLSDPLAIDNNGAEAVSAALPMPDLEELPSPDNIVYRFKTEGRIDDEWSNLYTVEPPSTADWSRILWRFIHKSLDIGMSPEEVLSIARSAACNKFARDNRPISYLWRDIAKAAQEHDRLEILLGGKIELATMPHLVDWDDFEEDTFIKDYKDWANHATDAPEQYHELTCFITLSAVVCSGLWLAVDWGEIVPNLWGLVLGESTLTRKTTAMRLAVDMLKDIDESLILATDGSVEGMFDGLAHRPDRVSIFWKDEVSGFFDSINKKDYLAGLQEHLTQLYDVPSILTRRLRKEVITIKKPYFIFFGGGIRDKVYSLINDEYIFSGFLPRFLVVSGENDLTRLRLTGPPSTISTERKDHIYTSLADLKDRFNSTVEEYIVGQKVQVPARIEARLDDDAWKQFSEYEEKLINAGNESDVALLALPTFTRLAFSILKMSLLVAASRREPDSSNILRVNASDVRQAAFYVEKWGHYSVDMITNAGRSSSEKVITRALNMIKKREGLAKSELMQRMHLSARDAKDLIDTMSQRGLIETKQAGRGIRLYSIG